MDEHLQYMYGLERFGVRMGLEVVQNLLAHLGHPEQQFPSVHITGTNGKGSTAAFIDSVLRQTGLTVGLYTSPHIYTFHERVRVNGESISDEALIHHVQKVRGIVEEHDIHPTFFEFTTALAFLYFAEQKIDIAVLEAGLGGPLDAVNVVTPLVSVITNVGLDHMDILGPTTTDIAKQEVGIIKRGVPVVTAEQDARIVDIIAEAAAEKSAQLYHVQEYVSMTSLERSLSGQQVKVEARLPDGQGLLPGIYAIQLLGDHQLQNLGAALVVLNLLQQRGFGISPKNVKGGLTETRWEGRLDVVSEKPLVLVDGAHNVDGLLALRSFLATLPRHDVLVYGQKKGKDSKDAGTILLPLFKKVIVTQGAYEPEDAEVLAAQLRAYHTDVVAMPNVAKALREAREYVDDRGVIVIAGSLYMIADALSVLRKRISQKRDKRIPASA